MSYILDALRKAERERGSARLPSLTAGHASHGLPRGRLAAAALGLLLCAAAGLLLFFLPRSPGVRSQQPSATSAELGQPANLAARLPAAPPAPARSIPAETSPIPPHAPPEMPRVRDTPVPVTPPDRQGSVPVAGTHPDAGNAPPESVRPNPPAAAAPTDQPAAGAPADQPAAAAPPPKAVEPAPGDTQPAPAPLNEAISKMTLNILVYDSSEAARRAVINGKKYVKGDYVDGHYLVEDITLEGVVLSYKGERALLRPR